MILTVAVVAVQIVWFFIRNAILRNLPINGFGALIGVGVSVIGLAIGFIVQAGVWRAGLASTRGQAPSVSMLTQTDNIGPYVLTNLVVGLGAAVGFILCVIPGIIWLVLTAYAPLLSLDKGMGPGEAISTSISWVRSNAGQVVLLLFVAWLVYIAGALACLIGLLVTIPVALVAITYSYRVLGNEPVAP